MTQPALFTSELSPTSKHPQTSPPSLIDQLRDAGATPPATQRCRSCRARIVTGLDAPIAAFHVELEPIPLTPLGEAIVRLQQLRTYELRISRADRWSIQRRRAHRISERPAGWDDPIEPAFDVVADHRCGAPAAGAAAGGSVLAARHLRCRQLTDPDQCPY